MSTATSENQCTGCGATVTKSTVTNGFTVKGEGFWRDVLGGIFCNGEWGKQHYIGVEVPAVELPPVAIKPDHGSALDENNVCPTCFRKYEDDGFKFCTADDCPSHPDYRVAIKPEVALSPLENDMLAALQDAQEGFFNLKPALREIGCFNGTPKDKDCPCSLHKISRAIAKAEAVGA